MTHAQWVLRAGAAWFIGMLASATPATAAAWVRDAGICDAEALHHALATASPGDVVRVGCCRIGGFGFLVPAGVQLTGSYQRSGIRVPPGEIGVTLETEAGKTTKVSWLRIASDGAAAVEVVGDGRGVVDFVRIGVTRGVGVVAEDAAQVVIRRSSLWGTVNHDIAPSVPPLAPVSLYSTHGIVMKGVQKVRLNLVSVYGFARFGMLLVNSNSKVNNAFFHRNVGAGAMVHGGSHKFRHVFASENVRGDFPEGDLAAGFAISGGANLRGTFAYAFNNGGYGLFQDNAGVVELSQLMASNNQAGGVFVQQSEYLGIESSLLSENGLAGLVAVDSDMVAVSDTAVVGSESVSLSPLPATGDGVQLSHTAGTFNNVFFAANERAGVLGALALEQTSDTLGFEGVAVAGAGEGSFGVLLQQAGTPLAPVTEGITRFGPLLERDQGWFVGEVGIETVGVQQPCFLPQPIQILEEGLRSLFFVTG